MKRIATKRLGTRVTAITLVAVFAAVQASSAFGAATTEDVQWFTGAFPGVALAGTESISASQVGAGKLKTTAYEFTYTGVKCVECKIKNSGTKAVGTGALDFTGLTVARPAGCISPTSITTQALTLEPDWMVGTTDYWKFTPTTGPTTTFVQFEMTGCPMAANIIAKGVVFFQAANVTGVQVVEQGATSSEAIDTAASGAAGALKLNSEPAELGLTANFKLSGAKAGEKFGTH